MLDYRVGGERADLGSACMGEGGRGGVKCKEGMSPPTYPLKAALVRVTGTTAACSLLV